VAEIMFISAAYTFIVRFALHVDKDFIVLFAATFFYTALVLLLPYCVSWLYFALHETEQELERLMSREDNFANMIPVEKDEMLHFRDEKGELRLSVAMSNLLFIKTSDNYVEIHYLYKNSPHRFLLRNSLKNMEEQYTSPMFFRCHRSYIVNFQKVKMLKNDKESMSLEMDIEGIPSIQVSKSYTNKVIKYFAGT
jgi:DNA-binding LytR/AlgR family response regulator